MPKYEDFKVGDVWICRDGSEVTVIDLQKSLNFPIRARVAPDYTCVFTKDGFYRADKTPHPYDLMRPKTPPLDLTKPLRFIGAIETFSASEIENAPEPVTLKRWATVDKVDGECSGCYDTREGAARNCSNEQVVVELTGEYAP